MTNETVLNYIVKAFDSFWFDTPLEHVNHTLDKDELLEWARLSIAFGVPKPFTLSMAAKRGGYVDIQIFVKPESGQGRAIQLAEIASAFFKSANTGSLVFYPHDLTIVGEQATDGLTTTEAQWFQVRSSIEFCFID